MTTLKKYTTSEGNKLEFVKYNEKTLIVIDNSCSMEKSYTIGRPKILSFEDYEKNKEDRTMIKSFDQVINAWKAEEIHF